MNIEKQLRQEQIRRKAENYADEFFKLPVESQKLWLVALFQEKEYLMQQSYEMGIHAASAQKQARIAIARSMGMSEEMIQKHLQG